MSKTLLFLRDHQIESMDQLETMVHARTEKRNELLSEIKTAEKRLTEISALRTHIINYSKTRPVYEAYRKAGYSKKFLEEHREEITLHKAAKQAFDALELQKIPRIKELSAEYAEVLSGKKHLYHEYRKVKDEVQELLIAQKNIASLYDAERKEEAQRQRQQEQSH
jgi:predicted S18 family serine protease